MATANLSDYNQGQVPDAGKMRFAIVVSDWNSQVTHSLLEGAIATLEKHGARKKNIKVWHVPGSFELVSGAAMVIEERFVDAVICLGCVIQGETPHFTFICNGVASGLAEINARGEVPVIFGVLTTNNLQEALDRAGGKHGNKGDEAAVTAISMANLKRIL
jgi:6,7-dimethyl-8-ribityllumazine synthase